MSGCLSHSWSQRLKVKLWPWSRDAQVVEVAKQQHPEGPTHGSFRFTTQAASISSELRNKEELDSAARGSNTHVIQAVSVWNLCVCLLDQSQSHKKHRKCLYFRITGSIWLACSCTTQGHVCLLICCVPAGQQMWHVPVSVDHIYCFLTQTWLLSLLLMMFLSVAAAMTQHSLKVFVSLF